MNKFAATLGALLALAAATPVVALAKDGADDPVKEIKAPDDPGNHH
jgi:hypothetical protein